MLKNKFFWIFFVFNFLILLVWWIGFYPALLTNDSVDQWKQAHSLGFKPGHPYIHTLIIYLFTRIWDSSSFVSLIQVLISAFIMAFFLCCINSFSVFKKNRIIFILFWLLYILSPVIGIYNIILWKDVLFSQLMFFMATIIVYCYFHKKSIVRESSQKYRIFFLSFLTFLVATVRLNGLPFIIIYPFIFWVLGIFNRRRTFLFAFFSIMFYLIYSFSFPLFFKVKMSDGFFSKAIKFQLISAIVSSNNGYLDADIGSKINSVFPIEFIKTTYSCNKADPVIFSEKINRDLYTSKVVDEIFNKIWLSNLNIILADRTCVFFSGLGFDTRRLLYSIPVTNDNKRGVIADYLLEDFDIDQVLHKPRSVAVFNFLSSYLNLSSIGKNVFDYEFMRFNVLYLLWMPISYVVILLVCNFISFFCKLRLTFWVSLSYLFFVLCLFFISIAQDFRYFLPIVYGSYVVFSVLLIELKEKYYKS